MVTVVCNETIGILVLVILPYIWRDIVSWLSSWFVVLVNSKTPPPVSSSRRTGGRSRAAEETERGKVTNGSSPENPLAHPEGLERSNQTVCTESLTSHEGEECEEDDDKKNDREERLREQGRRSSSGRGTSRTTGADHHYHRAANYMAGSKTVLRCSSPKRRIEPKIMEPFYDEISHEFSSTDDDPNDFSNTIRTNDDDDDHCDDDDVSEDAYIGNRRSIDEQEDEESEEDDDTTTSMDLDELQQSCSVSASSSPHPDRNDKNTTASFSSDPPAGLQRRLAKSDSCLITLTAATPRTTTAANRSIIAPAYCQVSQHLRRKLCSTTTSNNDIIRGRSSLVGGATSQQSSSFSSVSHHCFSSSSSPRLHSSHSRQSSLLYPTTTSTSSARLHASTSRLPSYTSPKQQPQRRKQPPNSATPKKPLHPPNSDSSSADNYNSILNARSVYLRQQCQQRGISINTSTPLSSSSSTVITSNNNNNSSSKVQVQQQQRGPTSSLQRDRDLLKRRLSSGY
jgi:hypothetical protein